MYTKFKSIEAIKEQKSSGQEFYYCQCSFFLCCWSPLLSWCFQGTPFCSGSLGSRLLLMVSIEFVSPPSPFVGNMLFVRAFYKWLLLVTRYKKLVENTEKGHVKQPDPGTVSARQAFLTATFMFLLWHYSSTDLHGFTKRVYHGLLWQTDLEPCERK